LFPAYYSWRKEPSALPYSATVFHVWISWAGFAIVLGVHDKLSAWSKAVQGRGHLENLVLDGRVILMCMRVLRGEGVEFLTGVTWLRIGFSWDFW
jgi:hypothetical protein